MNKSLQFFTLGVVVSLCAAGESKGAMSVVFTDNGSDLTMDYSGSVDVEGLYYSFPTEQGSSSLVSVNNVSSALSWESVGRQTMYYLNDTPVSLFNNSQSEIIASSGSGDTFGLKFDGTSIGISLAYDYTVGSSISGTRTWSGVTLESLGIMTQTLVLDEANLGGGTDTLSITGMAAVPEPSSTTLLGLGCASLLLRRKRK
jgi:hypothetical protein